MKRSAFIVYSMILTTCLYGQDGSDIRYFKTWAVDSSFLRSYVHFDFYNRSFGSGPADTITININDLPVKFVERRVDNGFNNWFSHQYLQSVGKTGVEQIRIVKFRLDSITTTAFKATAFLEYYTKDGQLEEGRSRQLGYWFNKKEITEVLIKSKQL